MLKINSVAEEMVNQGMEYMSKLESIKEKLKVQDNITDLDTCNRHIYRIKKTISKFEILNDKMIENELDGFQHKLNLASDFISLF